MTVPSAAPAVIQAGRVPPASSAQLRTSPLHEMVSAAGGQMVERCGALIVRDFGSAASEAALCLRAVGLADRSDLVKLELRDRPDRLLEAIEHHAGVRPDEGMAVHPSGASGAWWCLVEPGRAVVLCDACEGSHLLRVLELASTRSTVAMSDRTQELAVLAVVGPRAWRLLSGLCELDESEVPTPGRFVGIELDGHRTVLLREGPVQFLVLSAAPEAKELWRALQESGREHGAGLVGHEAIEHLAVNARIAALRTSD